MNNMLNEKCRRGEQEIPMMNGITMNKDNRKNKITRPEGCTLRNDFDKVFLNRHGYYELKEKNTQQER